MNSNVSLLYSPLLLHTVFSDLGLAWLEVPLSCLFFLPWCHNITWLATCLNMLIHPSLCEKLCSVDGPATDVYISQHAMQSNL